MNIAELSAKLHPTPLFKEFSHEEMEAFLNLVEPVSAPAGTAIVKQDERGDCMYVLVHGECKVVHHKSGADIDLAVLHEGDFFGEIALVDDGPRSADVVALSEVSLLRISQAVIFAIAGVYPSAGFKLLIAIGRTMVERLRLANRRYVDSMLFPVQGKD